MSTPARRTVLFALLALFGACAGARQPFLDRAHRANYALQPDELERVQFYLSDDILAHELGPSGALEGPEHVIRVERGTRGAVTEAGPHWLRVAFGQGEGVLFLADPDGRPDSVYLLASDGDAGQPPRRVQDLDDKVARVGARRFRVVYGASARLLIDEGDLSKLIEARPRVPGREPR
jgi:hypothetical protein